MVLGISKTASQAISSLMTGVKNIVTTGKWGGKVVTQQGSESKNVIQQHKESNRSGITIGKDKHVNVFLDKRKPADLTKMSDRITLGSSRPQKAVSADAKRARKTNVTLGQQRSTPKGPTTRERLARAGESKKILDKSTGGLKDLKKTPRHHSMTSKSIDKVKANQGKRDAKEDLAINQFAASYLRGLEDKTGKPIIPQDAKILTGLGPEGMSANQLIGKSVLKDTSDKLGESFSDLVEELEMTDGELQAQFNAMVSGLKTEILRDEAAQLEAQGKTKDEVSAHLASINDDVLTEQAQTLLYDRIEARVDQALSDPKIMAQIEDVIVRPEEL